MGRKAAATAVCSAVISAGAGTASSSAEELHPIQPSGASRAELVAPAAVAGFQAKRAPRMEVRIVLRSSMSNVQAAVDRCAGPVVTRHPGGQLISEHNYCSNHWVLRLRLGDLVRFRGKVSGLYRVRAIVYRHSGTGGFADLTRWVGGRVQAGMCASPGKTKWIGLVQVPPRPNSARLVRTPATERLFSIGEPRT